MYAPLTGDNVAGWVSQQNYYPLVDLAVYRLRMQFSTPPSPLPTDVVPVLSIAYDNYQGPPNEGKGNNYGGEAVILDMGATGLGYSGAAQGANGIGRTSGRSCFEFFLTPNCVETRQWRGAPSVPAGILANSAFTPAADPFNDMRILVRLLDTGSGQLGSNSDYGTVCLNRFRVQSHPISQFVPGGPSNTDPITVANFKHAIQTVIPAGNSTAAIIDNPLDSTPNAGIALFNFDDVALNGGATALYSLFWYDETKPWSQNLDYRLYPITWTSDKLYKGVFHVRAASATGGIAADPTPPALPDPADLIAPFFNTNNNFTAFNELTMRNLSTRGAPGPGGMHLAASPRMPASINLNPNMAPYHGAQPYVGFFYTQNVTAITAPESRRLRLSGEFASTPQLGSTGTKGGDPFAVEAMTLQEVSFPGDVPGGSDSCPVCP